MLIAKENHNSTIIWREINKKKKINKTWRNGKVYQLVFTPAYRTWTLACFFREFLNIASLHAALDSQSWMIYSVQLSLLWKEFTF